MGKSTAYADLDDDLKVIADFATSLSKTERGSMMELMLYIKQTSGAPFPAAR